MIKNSLNLGKWAFCKKCRNLFFCLFAIFLTHSLVSLQAQPNNLGKGSYYNSIRGKKAKYPENFPNYDYVNKNAPKGGDITLSTMGSFDSLNPFIIKGEPASGLSYIYDTLTSASEDENSVSYGLLAKRIYQDNSKKWVAFEINSQAKWHDGKPVTAADVVWTFQTIMKKGSPQLKIYYADVKNVRDIGNNIVRFDFAKPNPEMGYILGQLIVLPSHYWKTGGRDFSKTTLEPPLGSGPYFIEKVDPGKRITYRRFEKYWARDLNVNKGRYNFNSISTIYFANRTAERIALKSGQVDFFFENTAKEWATSYDIDVVKQGHLVKKSVPDNNPAPLQGFGFNTRKPIFKDRKVRQAIALAFDFEWVNRTLFYGAYTRSSSYFNNSDFSAKGKPNTAELKLLTPFKSQLPKEVFEKPFQPPKTDGSGNNRRQLLTAAKLLEEAGWSIKNGVLQNKAGQTFAFEILLVNPAFERVVAPFAQNLKRLGIAMRINTATTAAYINRLNAFDFDMTVVLFGQSDSPGNEQRYFWGSSAADQQGSKNLMGIKSPAVDALIEKIISAKDREDLKVATRALDRVLLWDYYIVHNWYNDEYRLLYWNDFALPKTLPKYSFGFDTWWIDAKRSNQLKTIKKR